MTKSFIEMRRIRDEHIVKLYDKYVKIYPYASTVAVMIQNDLREDFKGEGKCMSHLGVREIRRIFERK